jgi:tripartite-type tricarboxylate transporter receptor subunit TctC
MSKPFSIILQHVLPQHFLTRLFGKIANTSFWGLKRYLIPWYIKHYQVNMQEALHEDVSHYKTFNEFLLTTKSLSFAINGYGSSEHIASESLFVHTKGKHLVVPYPVGGNKGALDVMAGIVDCTFGNYAGIKAIMLDTRITVLFASHDMGDKILTWEQYFKEPFPYQSYVALVVSKSMEPNTKKKIVTDVSKVFFGQEFKDITFSTGLLPVGSTEQWMINSVLKSNKALTRFIQNNKLEIKQ